MKTFVLSLAMCLAFCATSTFAQNVNLVETTWVINYTTGKANSKDYQEYAIVTFKQGSKLVFDNGDTGTWKLVGNKLTIQNGGNTTSVHYVEAILNGNTGNGTAKLGMTTTVPYSVRLVKQNSGVQSRVYWSNASSGANCSGQCLARRHDIGYAGYEYSAVYLPSTGRCQCTLSKIVIKSPTKGGQKKMLKKISKKGKKQKARSLEVMKSLCKWR